MGLMGIGGNDKRGIIWIFCYVADFEMHWLGAYGRSSSDGAADLQFFDCFSDLCTISFTFLYFPLFCIITRGGFEEYLDQVIIWLFSLSGLGFVGMHFLFLVYLFVLNSV